VLTFGFFLHSPSRPASSGLAWESAIHTVGMGETRMMTGGPKTGMRVELSTAFEVLAHELRGCTSVIQGYVRLLQQSRGQDAPDAALLAKLLEATSRLTTLGKQATDVASWSTRDATGGEDSITMTQLLTDVTSLLPETTIEVVLPDSVASASVPTSSRTALTGAVSTLISALSRHTSDRAVALGGQATEHDVTVVLAPRGRTWSAETASSAAGQDFLAQGGLNLSLVLASQVLAAHGARIEATSERPPVLAVHFAPSRGPQ
jgi:light-regulated signal transduction histidine kinase (bacteriophytochrome)